MPQAFHDLLEIIGEDAAGNPGYCASPHGIGPCYWDWEDATAIPRLKQLGYQVLGNFFDGDRDSFGPLSRVVRVEKDGVTMKLIYG